MVTYLATQFLGKPPRDSLPIVSAYSFASAWQLALIESAEAGIYYFH